MSSSSVKGTVVGSITTDTVNKTEESGGGMQSTTAVPTDPLTVVLNRFEVISRELKDEFKASRTENKNAINSINKEVNAAVKYMKDNFLKISKNVTKLERENQQLKKEIESLRHDINVNTQNRFCNTLKIYNIPEAPNENLFNVFEKICNLIGFQWSECLLDNVYRLRRRANQSSPPITMVKFIRNSDKSRFLKLKKSNKPQLFSTELDSTFEKLPIYINEYLTTYNLKIFRETRQMKSDGIFEFVWCRNGNIFARRNANSKVLPISSLEDLNEYRKTVTVIQEDPLTEQEEDYSEHSSQVSDSSVNRQTLTQTLQPKKRKLKATGLTETIKETIRVFGQLDILINNAGIGTDPRLGWKQIINVNFTSLVQGTLLGMKYMGKEGGKQGGTIVNIGSLTTFTPFECAPIYSATKSAVNQFSRSIGTKLHYKRTGVRVISVNPGMTDTAILKTASDNILEELKESFNKNVTDAYIQSVDNMGKGLIEVLKKAETGTLWVIECDNPPKRIDFILERYDN